jgi:hypothetical protein
METERMPAEEKRPRPADMGKCHVKKGEGELRD